jgi:hypothetical protein
MNNDKMVFSITAYGKTVTITQPDDIDMYDFLDTCRDLATTIGYDVDTWKDAVIEMGEMYIDIDRRGMDQALQDYTAETNQKAYTGKGDLDAHYGPFVGIDHYNC